MQNMEHVTHDNFLLFCARHYDNPQCYSTLEFEEDLQRLKYIKKLVTRFCDSGDLKERLILNHIIVLSNVFPPEILCKILWLKMPESLPIIKPFLILLNLLPDKLFNVDNKPIINTDEVPMNQRIIDVLRKI